MSSRPKRKRAWRALLQFRRCRIYDAGSIEITIGGVTFKPGGYVDEESLDYDMPASPVRADHPALRREFTCSISCGYSWEPVDITVDLKVRRKCHACNFWVDPEEKDRSLDGDPDARCHCDEGLGPDAGQPEVTSAVPAWIDQIVSAGLPDRAKGLDLDALGELHGLSRRQRDLDEAIAGAKTLIARQLLGPRPKP
jgi:hypothetical protein